MTDFDRRQDDFMVAQLSQKFSDFIERYDRDCGALGEWRKNVDIELRIQSKILEEISPTYNRGKWIVGIIMLGSLGIAVKTFWAHIIWH